MDQDPDKSWSGTESEPISEGNAVEHMAFPGSSASTQPPVTPKPISFSNLPQITSTPVISSQKVISPASLSLWSSSKFCFSILFSLCIPSHPFGVGDEAEVSELPCGSKSDAVASESSEEESEESEEVEDSEDEEEEEDEEDENVDEEDDEEDCEEGEDNEESEDNEDNETSVAITQEGDHGREVPEMSKIPGVEENCDVQLHHDANMEPTVQPEPSSTLVKYSDCTKEHFSLMEAKVSENRDLTERAELEDLEREKIILSEVTNDAMEKAVLQTLDIKDGCLLSGIRVESTFSDEEENNYSNTGAFRTPLQISGTTPRTEKNYKGDGDEENWDEDEDSEPIRAGKHSGVSEFSENTLVVEPNITSRQSKMVSKKPHEIGDEKNITYDIKADNTGSQTLSQLSTIQGKADDDSHQENVNETTNPSKSILKILGHKEEPESSEDTWGSGSENEKEGSVEGDTSDTEPVNLKLYEREFMRVEDRTVIHHDDENLPVSMIVGSDHLEDTERHIRLPDESVAKDGELVCHEEIPQTVIDDIDVTSYPDKNDEDKEHGNVKVQEPLYHIIPEQRTLQVWGSLT